jgi:hypothetical protein
MQRPAISRMPLVGGVGMPIVKDKYRGTTLYHLIHAELIAAARYRGTVTYQEIAQIMGLLL